MKKIRVAAVSYLNTKPLLYGIRNHPVSQQIELIEDYPAKIAQMLIDGHVDLGLIPVAATTKLESWQTITKYCIGCNGAVASVAIFSEVPMEEIETVMLDNQSRTSVNLAKILLRDYWKKPVRYIETTGEDFRDRIAGKTAAVVIGDRALEQRHRSAFIYDLGEAWKKYTQLPFVFAAWITTKQLPAEFIQQFNDANAYGVQHLRIAAAENSSPLIDLEEYFTRFISYELDEGKRQGMALFLRKLREMTSA